MERLDIVHAYVDGTPMKEIQEKFGVTRATVYYYLRKHKVKPNRRKILDSELVKKIVARYEEGVPLKDIYSEFNYRCDMVIYRNVEGNRIEYLNDEQKTILEENYGKVTNKELAKMLGVCEATITFHTRGRKAAK